MAIAAEHRGEIEAEAVDVHLHHPVAQRVEDEIAHDRMRRIDRLSGAGEVTVEALVVVQPVVDRVVDSPESRPSAPARCLRTVWLKTTSRITSIPGAVEGPDHLLELQHLRAAVADAGVRGLGREEAERIVAPEVLEALAGLSD